MPRSDINSSGSRGIDIGRFHIRRRTNRLDGQMVSDGQIV